MPLCNCNCRCGCTGVALIVSAILGVLAAFLQITGVITVTPVFLWVALGIAVVYLGVQVVAAALADCPERNVCRCAALNALLVGILGTILLSLILLSWDRGNQRGFRHSGWAAGVLPGAGADQHRLLCQSAGRL